MPLCAKFVLQNILTRKQRRNIYFRKDSSLYDIPFQKDAEKITLPVNRCETEKTEIIYTDLV